MSECELHLAELMRPGYVLTRFVSQTPLAEYRTPHGVVPYDARAMGIFVAGGEAIVRRSKVDVLAGPARSRTYKELHTNALGPVAREREARLAGCDLGVFSDVVLANEPKYVIGLLKEQEKDLSRVLTNDREQFLRENTIVLVLLQRLSLTIQEGQSIDLRRGYRVLWKHLKDPAVFARLGKFYPMLVQVGNTYAVSFAGRLFVFQNIYETMAAWMTFLFAPGSRWARKREMVMRFFLDEANAEKIPVAEEPAPDSLRVYLLHGEPRAAAAAAAADSDSE